MSSRLSCQEVDVCASDFVALLRRRASVDAERVAVTFLADGEAESGSMTYAVLHRNARAIAAQLAAIGAASGRVVVACPPGIEFCSAFAGCLYAAAAAIPVPPPRANAKGANPERLALVVADARPAAVLSTAKVKPAVEKQLAALGGGAPAVVCVDELIDEDLATFRASEWRAPEITPQTIAFLQYTSGSTSTPRGVVLTHADLLDNSAAIRDAFGHSRESCGVIWLPPWHDMGLIGGILQPLFVGFPVVLMPPAAFLQRPIRWLAAVSRYGGTTSGGPAFAFDLCVEAISAADRAKLDLRTWDLAFCGAEPIHPATLERFAEAFGSCGFRREALYPCYGLAEATLIVTGGTKMTGAVVRSVDAAELSRGNGKVIEDPGDAIPGAACADGGTRRLVGCGHVRPGRSVRIVDAATCTPCPAGRVGEVWVGGHGPASGYWGRADETNATFRARLGDVPCCGSALPAAVTEAAAESSANPLPNPPPEYRGREQSGEIPFGCSDGSYLRTGDLGFLADDGELFVTGRLKDLIIIRGANHYPHDLERTAQASHPALAPGSGAAVAVNGGGRERLVLMNELLREHRRTEPDAVFAAIREAIADQHELRPNAIVLLEPGQIPKTSSGKVQRLACRDAFVAGTLPEIARWVAPEVETGTDDAAETGVLEQASSADGALGIQRWLTTRLANALGVAVHEIDPAEPFARYGLDSASAVTLAGELATACGQDLPPTLFWDYPSATEMAQYLSRSLNVRLNHV